MAAVGVFTTTADIVQKAGKNVDVAYDNTMQTAAAARFEALINCVARYNFSDRWATLNIDVQFILNDICSSLIAIEAICYNMSVFTSRIEAEDLINVLRDSALRGLALLRDKKVVDFMDTA